MSRRPNDRDDNNARRPPAFQEYGSDLLALERVKLMSLAERGLLATMRWHVWSNDTLPADPKLLARLLGLETAEVEAALTERVRAFFQPARGDATRLVCPELAGQMARYMERREKMLQGTLNSHKARKQQGKPDDGTQVGTQLGTHGGSERSGTAQKRTALGKEDDKSTTRSPAGPAAPDPFVREYDEAQAAERAGTKPR